MAVPAFLQAVLWSYDLSKMDKKKDAWSIITQVLNYGDKKAVKWLFSNYTLEKIKAVLLHPSRGVWFREKLRIWLSFFNLMIDPLEFEAAIRDLAPRVRITEEFFRRKGLLKDEALSANT